MQKVITLFVLIFLFTFGYSQELTQTIRGKVIERESKLPLPGVNVVLLNSDPLKGTATNIDGTFKLQEVPIGRQSIEATMIGYEPEIIRNIDLRSGKELILTIEMEQKVIETEAVVVKAYRKDKPKNEMATVSARSFTIEETEKFAGSWGDPARMATNYAGVSTGGSQVNDIIIRGNSPAGLLWRLEGINIPNPNHFGSLGTTGGPISMLNNNVLSNSDFFTGAFPAEYGDALAGAFDLKMRNGNNEKREYLAQVGFNGFELGAEGPFSKEGKSSYLFNYRYSTLGVLNVLGIELGVGAVPYYQDLSFKLNFPRTKLGHISIFGLGGKNHIHYDINETDTLFDNTIEETHNETKFASSMGVIGFSQTIYLNSDMQKASRLKNTIAVSGLSSRTDSYYEVDNVLENDYGDERQEIKYSFKSELLKKFNSRNTVKLGGNFDMIQMSYLDSFYYDQNQQYYTGYDLEGTMGLLQVYSHWKHKFSDMLTINAGLHGQYLNINNDFILEPRLGVEWEFLPKHHLKLGYGLHSQTQPRSIYFLRTLVDTTNRSYISTNENLEFSKSHHFVLGYDHSFNSTFRVKVETYYQQLFDIPVESDPSYFSMINYGLSYYLSGRDSLVNSGTARNYGVDITLEKFLSNNFYFLTTLSLFDSKYRDGNDVLRNTIYNGNFVVNALGGYEHEVGNNNAIAIDVRAASAGGLWSIPVREELSMKLGEVRYDYANAYTRQNKDYFRLDLRLSFKMNKEKFSQEWALDITNLTNRLNHFITQFDPDTGEYTEVSQQKMMPMMFWRIVF
jgi:hypothetical protein